MSFWFEWSTSSDLAGASSSVSQTAGSGTSPLAVSAQLTNLQPDTVYYFRVATSSRGHSDRGAIASFRTAF
jgi:phosphodiesterase/alkaline phosphatase D-like protein